VLFSIGLLMALFPPNECVVVQVQLSQQPYCIT
jgi:hypothetical protein